MKSRSLPRALGSALAGALAITAVGLSGATPVASAPATITSAEVTYTFVVGELADPGDRLVLDVGHTDAIAPTFEDGELVVRTKDDTNLHTPGVTFRDPEDLIFQVKPAAEVTVPPSPAYAFLGEAGDPVWILPLTQDHDLLWPGWSTEHPSLAGEFAAIDISITGFDGPGDLFLFSNGGFGEVIPIADTAGGPTTWSAAVPAHVHANWAFTQPGTYSITVQVEGEWLNAPDPVETTLSIDGADGHFHTSDTVTLTAVQDPPTGEDHYHWFVKPAGAAEFVIVNGEVAGTYSFTAGPEHDGAQYIVRLYDHDHAVIAESAPVTLEVDDHEQPEPPELSQTITATLEEEAGALVVSVDPDDRQVTMSPLALSSDGERFESTGELRPILVTDTRSSAPGWSLSGQVGAFSSGTDDFGAEHLGWSPLVVSQSDGQGVATGAPVVPGGTAGEGLSVSRPLASAPAGSGTGSAHLGGGLELHVPPTVTPGTYTATLTLTAI